MSLSALLGFARACLDADQYPGDHHKLTIFRCARCGVRPLTLTIEHHSGSSPGDFKGVIAARCSACGREEQVFSFTGEHRKWTREEKPACSCGNDEFLAAMLERIEGEQGLVGFFDEGVVVGECSQCGRHTAFVYTD